MPLHKRPLLSKALLWSLVLLLVLVWMNILWPTSSPSPPPLPPSSSPLETIPPSPLETMSSSPTVSSGNNPTPERTLSGFVVWEGNANLSEEASSTLKSFLHHHPHSNITVFSNTLQSPDLLSKLRQLGYSVQVERYDLENLTRGTPLEKWWKSGALDSSPPYNRMSNISNALRLLLLYTRGGIYMDTDLVILKPFFSINNCVGKEDDQFLNGAVLVFSKGHAFLDAAMKEFTSTFRPAEWGWNGPKLLTRTLSKYRGKDVTVLPQSAFYPIHWKEIASLFQKMGKRERAAYIDTHLRDSFAVHYNTFLSKKRKGLTVEEGSVLHQLIEENTVLVQQ